MYEHRDVKITNKSIKVESNVKFKQDGFDGPLRIKSVGMRRWVITGCAIISMLMLLDINVELETANRLKEDEIKIKKEQLELARRQYTLDSIALSPNLKTR